MPNYGAIPPPPVPIPAEVTHYSPRTADTKQLKNDEQSLEWGRERGLDDCKITYINWTSMSKEMCDAISPLVNSARPFTATQCKDQFYLVKKAWIASQSPAYRRFLMEHPRFNTNQSRSQVNALVNKDIECLIGRVRFSEDEEASRGERNNGLISPNKTGLWWAYRLSHCPAFVPDWCLPLSPGPSEAVSTIGSGSGYRDGHIERDDEEEEDEGSIYSGLPSSLVIKPSDLHIDSSDPANVTQAEDGFDIESYVENLQSRLEAEQAELARATRAAVPRRLGIGIYEVKVSPPAHSTTREGYLAIIEAQLLAKIWIEGTGFEPNHSKAKRQTGDFVRRYVAGKTYKQLSVVANFGHLHLTPDVLSQSGLGVKEVDDQFSGIYFKYTPGDQSVLPNTANSANPNSARFAKKAMTFLTSHARLMVDDKLSETRPHHADRTPHVFHIGRFCGGINQRQGMEVAFGAYDPEKGARPWDENVYRSPGSSRRSIVYLLLADTSELVGEEWSRRMTYDEVFFALLFANPLQSNVYWPGLCVPEPPRQPGLRPFNWTGAVFPNQLERQLRAERGSIALQQNIYGLDECSKNCLVEMGFDGTCDPVSFLRNYSPRLRNRQRGINNTNYVVCYGLDQPFPLPYRISRQSGTGRRVVLNSKILMVYISPDSASIIIRPLGTSLPDYTTSPIKLMIRIQCRTNIPPFIDCGEEPGIVSMTLSRLPGNAKEASPVGMKTEEGDWISMVGTGPAELDLQEEGKSLLFGRKVSRQRVDQLEIQPRCLDGSLGRTTSVTNSSKTIYARPEKGRGTGAQPKGFDGDRNTGEIALRKEPNVALMETWNQLLLEESTNRAALLAHLTTIPDQSSKVSGLTEDEEAARLEEVWRDSVSRKREHLVSCYDDHYDLSSFPGSNEYRFD